MRPASWWREFPRELKALLGANFINRMGTMALPFLVLYLTERRGFTVAQAGMIFGVYGAGAVAAGPLSGWLADRWGSGPVMIASLLASGSVVLLYPLAGSSAAIILLTMAWSLTNALFRPAANSMVGALAPPAERKAAFSVNRLSLNLGLSVGVAAGGFLAQRSFATLFAVDGATSLLAGVFLWNALRRGRAFRAPEGASHSLLTSLRDAARDRRLGYFLLALLPALMVFYQHSSTMTLFMVRGLGISLRAYGLLFALNTALIVLVELPLNFAMARWPHHRSLSLGAGLLAGGFGMLAFVRGVWGAALSIVVWTFGEMILFPSSPNYVADIAPEGRQGSFLGLYSADASLALMLGPVVGTRVMQSFGAPVLWIGCLACGLISAGLFRRLAPDPAGTPRLK